MSTNRSVVEGTKVSLPPQKMFKTRPKKEETLKKLANYLKQFISIKHNENPKTKTKKKTNTRQRKSDKKSILVNMFTYSMPLLSNNNIDFCNLLL